MRIASALLLLATTTAAHAESIDSVAGTATKKPADQGIGASVGMAGGGGMTPGGLRVAGHYLYQLSDTDWFDGVASFTFGGGSSGCTTTDMTQAGAAFDCSHGSATGHAVEIGANVRRMFGSDDAFQPFARAGVGVSIVRFTDVSGVALPLHLGGGLRARVTPAVAVVAQAELDVGFGAFGRGLGLEPQFGMAITAGAEFELR